MSIATADLIGEHQQILLDRIPWETYEALLEGIGERSGIRLAYNDGYLEIMTLSISHESFGSWIDHLITMLTFELDIAIRCGGSTTMKRKLERKGLEPDKCYWIEHHALMRGVRDLDLEVNPPPDLAVEVEVSRKCLDRLPIYAALKVPEIWRFDGENLHVCHLQRGKYRERKRSIAFPFLPLEKFAEFIRLGAEEEDETSLLRSFVRWIRSEIVPNLPG